VKERATGRHQQRPHPLAAADRGITHRLEQRRARVRRDGDKVGKQAVEVRADPFERWR
jgi:hypothetical protein